MSIKKLSEKKKSKLEIDLSGPDGNAYVLMGIATKLAKQLGQDSKQIINEMKSSDYDNLVNVFDSYFGEHVILYR
jgi:hypothetical protein